MGTRISPLSPWERAHKGRFFSDTTLTLAPVSLSHRERGEKPTPESWERARVREVEVLNSRGSILTLTLPRREREY
jgi:hypothetical protein